MEIEQATREDLQEILKLQKHAYRSEADIYGDDLIPPMIQHLDEITDEFSEKLFLKTQTSSGTIIGSVRAFINEGSCFIGRLIVHPNYQNQGIGAALMQEVERRFPQVKRFELFTGHRSEKNLHIYRKLGYREYRRETINNRLELVYMEKNRGKSS